MSGKTRENLVFYYTAPKRLELVRESCPPPGPGQVRCRTVCSLVSIGTEMICYAREVEKGTSWDEWIQYPFPPGYLSVGEVTDLGRGAEGLALGDRVCSSSPHRAWFVDSAEHVHPVPRDLLPEHAAWFFLNVIVQNGIREAAPVFGETAVVLGLGPLGQLAVRLLGLVGLKSLVAVDPLAARCEMARGCGPTEILCCGADKALERVRELTLGRGAEMVFDITGHPDVFHAAQHMLCKRGRLGLIGDVPSPSRQTLTHDIICKSCRIVGAHGANPPWKGNDYYRWGKREMTDLFFGFILDGRISLDRLVTHRIKPDQAPQVYADIYASRDKYLGVIIDWA